MHKIRLLPSRGGVFLPPRGLLVGTVFAACVISAIQGQDKVDSKVGSEASLVAVRPLEEKIEQMLVAAVGAASLLVEGDAFRQAAERTGLRIYSMKEGRLGPVTDAELTGARAVMAGYDLLVDVTDPDAVFWGIASAVERGDVTLERIDAAVARIRVTMQRAGIPTR